MSKIKIISNPYQKSNSFQKYNEDTQQWVEINYDYNSNSKLLSDKLAHGFFPFRAKDILDEIIKEYHSDAGKIELIFEGTEDEYKELLELCKSEAYSEKITLVKSDLYLENARDILPDINDIYTENIYPLVIQSVTDSSKIAKEMAMYTDASNEVIPICVLGNYSAGKSTFINALIGSEILPSGAEPITAKIYKIKQSAYLDRAYIQLKYDNSPIKIKFDENSFKFSAGTVENDLTKRLTEVLSDIENADLTTYVNKALEIINSFDSNTEDEKVSDLIEIEVPFISGLWGESTRQFVIFDTPGSNSASNNRHLTILKEAMEGFSNGLPIFISEFDKLDSTDNESLYKEIESMKELDDRFTMIVVNKADAAELDKGGFSKDKENKILSETIPKNLYTGGIFFVSSVIGLGSKSNGEFIDDHYAEIFEEKKAKFSDTSSRFYKTLYIYNIMPEQIKTKSIDSAASVQNLLFANSGLYTVEREIQTFAGKYSSYNKCQQSQLFLGKIIATTSDEIEKARIDREISRQKRDESLKKDEKELIDKIESTSSSSQISYTQEYHEYMSRLDSQANKAFTTEQLKAQEAEIERTKQVDNDFDERSSEAKKSFDNVFSNLKGNILKTFDNFSLDSIKTIGTDLVSDVKKASDTHDALSETKKEVDRETAKKLLEEVTREFTARFEAAQSFLDENSKQYWEQKSLAFKELLVQIVTGATVLDEEKRKELAEIIITYGNLTFENHAEEIFLKEDFKKGIKIAGWTLYESDKLNIEKLANRYNTEMTNKINVIRSTIQDSHKQSFSKWKESLITTITSNIVEYSPMLHSQAQIIKEETQKIMELEARQKQLTLYTDTIKKMMDWKEV